MYLHFPPTAYKDTTSNKEVRTVSPRREQDTLETSGADD